MKIVKTLFPLFLVSLLLILPSGNFKAEQQIETNETAVFGWNNNTITSGSYFYDMTLDFQKSYIFQLWGEAGTDFDLYINNIGGVVAYSDDIEYPEQITIEKLGGQIQIEIYPYMGTGEFYLLISDANQIIDFSYSDLLKENDTFTWTVENFSGNTSRYPFNDTSTIQLSVIQNLINFEASTSNITDFFELTYDGVLTNNSVEIEAFVQPTLITKFGGVQGTTADYLLWNNSFFLPYYNTNWAHTAQYDYYYYYDIFIDGNFSFNANYDPLVGILDTFYYDFLGDNASTARLVLDQSSHPFLRNVTYPFQLPIGGNKAYWEVTALSESTITYDYNLGSIIELSLSGSTSELTYANRYNPFTLTMDGIAMDSEMIGLFILPTEIGLRDGTTGDIEYYAKFFSEFGLLMMPDSVSVTTVGSELMVSAMLSESEFDSILDLTMVFDLTTGLMTLYHEILQVFGDTASVTIEYTDNPTLPESSAPSSPMTPSSNPSSHTNPNSGSISPEDSESTVPSPVTFFGPTILLSAFIVIIYIFMHSKRTRQS